MLDEPPTATPLEEARRQVRICNACRYCEGYCAVFPSMFSRRSFADADLSQLAQLCHNCRGCHYACQYTEPHEFALNLPAALADLRAEDQIRLAWPSGLAGVFQRSGVAMAAAMAAGTAILFLAVAALPGDGPGFYSHLSHAAMVAIFTPAFLFPLAALWVALRRYWREVGGGRTTLSHWRDASLAAATLRNLSGGAAKGCNFEKGDRYSQARRHAHSAAMWGFLLCFASTASGTILHYLFDWPAPYPFLSPPKLLGVPGGILLTAGAAALAVLKLKSDSKLGSESAWGGEMAFTLLLCFTGLSGLALYAATGTVLVAPLLAAHLGLVLTLFLTLPWSKMAHGFFRFAALLRDAQRKSP